MPLDTIDQPPARYAIGQPDFDWEIGTRLVISLDGVKQDHVTAYDCEAGTITRHKTDEEGKIVLNDTRDEIIQETVTGNVTVDWRD